MKKVAILIMLVSVLPGLFACKDADKSDLSVNKPQEHSSKSEEQKKESSSTPKSDDTGVKGSRAIVTAPRGLKLRKSPSQTADVELLIPHKAVVTLLDREPAKQSIDDKTDHWYKVSVALHSHNQSYTGYVFGAYIYWQAGLDEIELLKTYLLAYYPKLALQGSGGKTAAKTKSGAFITVGRHQHETVVLVDFIERLNSYLFWTTEDGEYVTYILINYNSGKKDALSARPHFYKSGNYFYTLVYPGFDDASLSIYKVESKSISKQAEFPLTENINSVRWLSDTEIALEYRTGENEVFTESVKRKGNSWNLSFDRNDVKKVQALLEIAEAITQSAKKNSLESKNGSFVQGLACLRYEFSEHEVQTEQGDQFSPYSLIKTDGSYDASKLSALYALLETSISESQIKSYYAFYKDAIRSYVRIYRIMRDVVGENTVKSSYKKALAALKKSEDRDYMITFYKQFMIDYAIDLKANCMHRKRNSVAVGFWMRRMDDGTAKTCFELLGRLLKEHDTAFYTNFVIGDGVKEEMLDEFPKVRINNEGNVQASIVDRKPEFDYLEYKLNVNGELRWISAYYLEFE